MDLQIQPTMSENMYSGHQLFDAVKEEARVWFTRSQQRKQALTTVEEIQQYQREKRQLFLESIGGLPEDRTDMHASVTGITQREGYRIENVIYQSRPNFHVTGLLYVPNQLREAKNPAVLFVCGHTALAKGIREYQFVCQELVRAGLIVLAIDPIGQGERQQYYLPDGGYGRCAHHIYEHSPMGLQCMLTGSSLAGYFIWDMMRAVDYLGVLPYVDARRIGVTGNSGGGTQSCYLMMTDERLAAAAPCTYITDRQLLLEAGRPQDAEQNLFRAISDGVGIDDYLITFAPKPVMVGAARYDFFHLKGTEKSMASARRVYGLFGKEDACTLVVADTQHTYSPALRKAMVNFFLHHLCGLPPTHPGYPNEALLDEPREVTNCTASGNLIAEFPGERRVFNLNQEYLQQHSAERKIPDPETVARVLGIADKLPLRRTSTYRIEVGSTHDDDLYADYGVLRKRIEFFAEEGIYLNGIYFQERRTEGTRPPLCLLIPEEGLADGDAMQPRVLDLIWSGNAVFICDVRGVGVSKMSAINCSPYYGQFGTEFTIAFDYFMLGRSLPGLRAFDVLRAIDCLTEMGGDVNTEQITVQGYGLGALYALYAAALEPRITGGILEGMLPSYAEICNAELYSLTCAERHAVHGILRYFDIPDMLHSLAPRRFEISNPLTVGAWEKRAGG